MCLNYNNNITVASFTGATAMTRVSTSGQCTYLYKVRHNNDEWRDIPGYVSIHVPI